ncbi:sialate O-acetylesterase [Melioribacter sp. OK-6-Me]|uniref:sialate O-acetylesterase n=1 Tax=unclassified Melioribacter TaxID=2627329 RepID=UPI003ED97947
MKKLQLIIILLLITFTSNAQVRLPKLIGDGMVLQRNTPLKIWGWASKGEKVKIKFVDTVFTTTTSNKGEWQIIIPPKSAGGPYKMEITASNKIIIDNILIGDVWVCSGQSNMELPMSRVEPLYKDVIANSNNKFIRQFYVPRNYCFTERKEDFSDGKWISTNPRTVLNFTAVGYFFARYLYEKYNVPIGLINASLGGSPAEAWMSEEALKEFPQHYEELQKFKDSSLIEKIRINDSIRINNWYTTLRRNDAGYSNPNMPWYSVDMNISDWDSILIPGYWTGTPLEGKNGVVWFRKEIELPDTFDKSSALLLLGRIVDADSVFINGKFVGTVSYQYPPRRYQIPEGILKTGKNLITVRVISNIGSGGFVPDKPYELVLSDTTIDLKGYWKYKVGAVMPPLESQTFIMWKPGGLFNAMLAPLLNYRIKGVIWYQGESNAERPFEYRRLFPALIRDWRNNWNIGSFPFLFVQLANFMEHDSVPSNSNWALLREAQAKALELPNTGMAVTIDIGEWNDIHPLNKKDVGKRLALAAMKIAYGEDITYSGPIYKSMEIDSNKIIISFSHTGSGLVCKGDELKHFAIAGTDKKFVWAKAAIKGDKVIVWSDEIKNPVAVRYAWADNPEGANLYNSEGLPACPFRTDEW